ncbi:MAG: hypothetical protein Fur006_09760 [Coleofasciculaceae cyanobacterium]
MSVAQYTQPSASDITITLKRLVALLEEDDIDDYGILQPSQYAFKTVMKLVVEAYELMGDRFPKASASTDEEGGIRLTWTKLEPECEIRLICPAHANLSAYLYHELGESYAVEHDISASTLVHWLERLNQV